MGNAPTIGRVEVTLYPETETVRLAAFNGPDSQLPVLLEPSTQTRIAEAVALTLAPEIGSVVEMAQLLSSLLDYVVGRVLTDEGVLLHPDGEPVVSEGWLAACNDLRRR